MSYHGGRASYRDAVADLPPAPSRAAGKPRGRPPGSGRWDDIVIWRELEAYTREMTSFPSATEMAADGRSDLLAAVNCAGGMQRWSGLVNLPLGPRQDRRPYRETDAIRDALELIRRLGRLPGKEVVRREGFPRLASYMAAHRLGGKEFTVRYAGELGLDGMTSDRLTGK